jgi:tRNA threonylcarbamoyladenosine modification (KEOPS) complex  Pcc1 subunit
MIYSKILIEIPEEFSEVICSSLRPESEMPSSSRSHVNIHIQEEGILLTIKASDTTAMRAAINSYLRWIMGILNMFNEIK